MLEEYPTNGVSCEWLSKINYVVTLFLERQAISQNYITLIVAVGAVVQLFRFGGIAIQHIKTVQMLQALQQRLLDIIFTDKIFTVGSNPYGFVLQSRYSFNRIKCSTNRIINSFCSGRLSATNRASATKVLSLINFSTGLANRC